MTNSNSSISKHYHQLTSVQRGQIQAMLDSGITSRTVIAQEVGCHKSTISREIKRGSVLQRDSSYLLYEHYYADTAASPKLLSAQSIEALCCLFENALQTL